MKAHRQHSQSLFKFLIRLVGWLTPILGSYFYDHNTSITCQRYYGLWIQLRTLGCHQDLSTAQSKCWRKWAILLHTSHWGSLIMNTRFLFVQFVAKALDPCCKGLQCLLPSTPTILLISHKHFVWALSIWQLTSSNWHWVNIVNSDQAILAVLSTMCITAVFSN